MGSRSTPLAVVIAVAAVLLAGAGIVAVAAHDGDHEPVREALVGQNATSSTLPPDTTTSTTVAPASTTTSPPTTVAPTTTTRPTTTTARRPTTTTTRLTTTTAPPADRPLCAVDQIGVSVATDAQSYLAAQPVRLTTTIRNRSTAPCFYQGYTVLMSFRDPARVPFLGTAVHLDDPSPTEFRPGQSLTQSFTWDPASCPSPPVCARPTPDIYSVEAAWSFSGGRYTATMDFVLR
ncbi:MAG: hypothetical protein M3326_16800 [Actinomycetota bacterium]|nr:hypothetical protein [Actinomycetota bacterium]